MATDRTVAVYPSGASVPGGYAATYTTLAAAEAGENGDLTAGGGTRLIIEIVNSDGSWSGFPDTVFVDWDGWTCDRATGEYVLVRTIGGARSSTGLWDTTAYIITNTGGNVETIDIDNDFNVGGGAKLDIEFNGVQFDHPADIFPVILIHASSLQGDVRILNCYVRTAVAYQGIDSGQSEAGLVIHVKNCIIECTNATPGVNHGFEGATTATTFFYNNTVFGFDVGIEENSAGTTKAINNAVFDNETEDIKDVWDTEDYNATDDSGGTNRVDISPGTESDGWAAAFTDYAGSQDVTVKDTGSVLYQAGLDQNSDSEIPSDDINGTTRPSGANAVSIGAFEFETEAPPVGMAGAMTTNTGYWGW